MKAVYIIIAARHYSSQSWVPTIEDVDRWIVYVIWELLVQYASLPRAMRCRRFAKLAFVDSLPCNLTMVNSPGCAGIPLDGLDNIESRGCNRMTDRGTRWQQMGSHRRGDRRWTRVSGRKKLR